MSSDVFQTRQFTFEFRSGDVDYISQDFTKWRIIISVLKYHRPTGNRRRLSAYVDNQVFRSDECRNKLSRFCTSQIWSEHDPMPASTEVYAFAGEQTTNASTCSLLGLPPMFAEIVYFGRARARWRSTVIVVVWQTCWRPSLTVSLPASTVRITTLIKRQPSRQFV